MVQLQTPAQALPLIIDERFEKKVLACAYRVQDFAAVAAEHLKPAYFGDPVRHNLARLGLDFFRRYRTRITHDAFARIIKEQVDKKKIGKADIEFYAAAYNEMQKADVSDWAYVLDNLIMFIKNRAMKRLIEESVKKLMPNNDFEAIEKRFREISAISTNIDASPMDYYSEAAIDERFKRREEEATAPRVWGISTGITQMDKVLYKGGWYEPLNVLLAPAKRGKTMALLFFSNMAAKQGFNVAFFSCETSKEILSDRLDAMNSETEMKALLAKRNAVRDAIKAGRPEGRLFLWEYPTKSLTVAELERQVRRIEMEENITIGLIVADYAGIMKPAVRYRDDKLAEEAGIFEDLRALGTRRNHPVLTAGQVNRANTDKKLIKGTGAAGNYEKIMVADCIITLSATEEELLQGFMRIHFSEYRNGESKTLKIKTQYGMGRFYKDFVEVVH